MDKEQGDEPDMGDKRICIREPTDDLVTSEPGPSGLQQTYNLPVGDDSLEVMLAEMEKSSVMVLNTAVSNTGNDRPISMDELNTLLAINETFKETLENLIRRVTLAISKNREAQKLLKAKQRQVAEHGLRINVKKVPVSRFMFPYFRDSHEMEPPKNKEYELKVFRREYDPLVKAEKKWTAKECQILANAVRKSLIEIRIQPFIQRKEVLCEKIRAAGRETSMEQINEWKSAVVELERLISYHKELPANEVLIGDYSEVDWAKIAKIDFLGNRTPKQVRLKWINEQSPRWSKEPWSAEEIERLRECAERWNNWNVIAERLGTNRSAFQCFVKFKSELEVENIGRSWTKEEDAQLMTLAHCMQVNGKMQWEKISHYMEERSRQQCTIRYRRALDTDIKFGRWDASEDVLLTCAVSRCGTKDWIRVASYVPGRSDSQCRDRWVNVLDKSIKAEPWSVDEDEKLLEGVKIFGKGEWSRISAMIPGRSAAHCKSRFRSLLSAKVKLASECHTYPFRRFSWKGKYRRQEVEATFRKLLAADGKGGLAEEVMKSFDMRALSIDEMEALSAMAPEQRLMVMQFLNEVREKHLETGGADDQTIWKLLSDKLQFDTSYLDSSTQAALLKYYKRFLGGSTCDLLTHDEKDAFDMKYRVLLETDSEATKDHVINGLCDLIDRNDNQQCRNYQNRFTRTQVLDEIDRYLHSVLIHDVNKSLSFGIDAFAIPPCTGTVHLYENIQQQVPLLRGLAREFFEPLVPGQDDSLFLQLSRQITSDPEYVLLKTKIRTLLFWPMVLYRALESQESVERRMYLRSIAAAKLAEQQTQALQTLKARLRGQPHPLSSGQTPQALILEEGELDDDAAGLSVGEFLKQRMGKRPRRYLSGIKKQHEYSHEAESAEPIVQENTDKINHRIDECIESVRTAVEKIYERDFEIPAAYRLAAQQLKKDSACTNPNVEGGAVKSTLGAVIDEVASGGTSESASQKHSEQVADDGSVAESVTVSGTQQPGTRKRISRKDALDGGGSADKPMKLRKRAAAKLHKKDEENTEVGSTKKQKRFIEK